MKRKSIIKQYSAVFFSLRTSKKVIALLMVLSSEAFAGVGGGAINFGLGPMSAGTAMSFTPFLQDPMAVYYNPAGLAQTKGNEISVFGHRGDTELRAKSLGGKAPVEREGDVLSDSASELVVMGVTIPIAAIGSNKREYFFGFNLGVDNYTKNFLPFDASTSLAGQFIRYQSEPLYIGLGVAKSDLIKGVDVGLATRITLDATASLDASSDLAGNTDSESVTMKAKPNFSMGGVCQRSCRVDCYFRQPRLVVASLSQD